MEQETLYRALACPTDELLLTYHTIDAGGGETRPSYFVNTVRELAAGCAAFSTHRTETVRDRLRGGTTGGRTRVRVSFGRPDSRCAGCL